MACCTDGAACPMHKTAAHASGSKHVVSQAQADSCCAKSARNDSATTGSGFVRSSALALAPSPVPVILPTLRSPLTAWDPLLPLPRSPLRKHLLLSVFLV